MGDHPLTAAEISRDLTWSRSWAEISLLMRRAAMGETLAHLLVLLERGWVVERPDLSPMVHTPSCSPASFAGSGTRDLIRPEVVGQPYRLEVRAQLPVEGFGDVIDRPNVSASHRSDKPRMGHEG